MKRLLYCLLAVSFLFSCKQKALKNEFIPIVQGAWVKKSYIDEVLKSKSPALSAQLTTEIMVLNISTSEIKGDSLKVYVGKAAHQIADVMMYFRPGKRPHTILMADTEVGYHITGKDTVITLYFSLDGKPDSVQYIKALHKAPIKNVGDGLDSMLNKGLIAGKYTLQENGATKDVEFAVNGDVKGLGNYKTYFINNDYIKGMINVDGINLDMRLGNPSGLAYKIKGDTLDLYNIKVDEDKAVTVITGLKYHLVKKKATK